MHRILIIDDESAVRNVTRHIIESYVPDCKVVGEADSVGSGYSAIRELCPDIILLDIRMGDGTGFDLLKRFEDISFKIIFITAYEEYAILAIKFSAMDYLLKPISPDDLINAIRKAQGIMQQEMAQQLYALKENLDPETVQRKILVKTFDNIYIIKLNELVCCESDQAYCRLHLKNGNTILASRQLKEFEEMLTPAGFFRIHKSFVINLNAVDHFEKADGGFVVLENGMRVPVASRKREQFLKIIENMG